MTVAPMWINDHPHIMTRVLLVDDDIRPLHALGAVFEVHGFEVLSSEDGLDAFVKALKTLPNLVVTDWEMPRLDGISLCRRLRKLRRFARVPLVLTSGKTPPTVEGICDLFLRKPVNFSELEALIASFKATA
ncbi:response regulator [Caballeronia cordobensis]|uniref:response regulator n=1 Tax=Caballeronia cordobensis TaxID=1353886 RepID=UPI0009EC8ED8|nr:response regulator [Caballeronia cordobensis]